MSLSVYPFPPPSSSTSAVGSAPSAATGAASNAERNPAVAIQQAQENKYPLWKYVRRQQGPGAMVVGEGNVSWTCRFCNKRTYF